MYFRLNLGHIHYCSKFCMKSLKYCISLKYYMRNSVVANDKIWEALAFETKDENSDLFQ